MPNSAEFVNRKKQAEYQTHITDADGADEPGFRSSSYLAQMEDVAVVRDVMGGTKTMRARKEAYLPKHPSEEGEDYDARLKRAVLFNATERTVESLTGLIFRKDPILGEDVPTRIADDMENVDMAGRDLPVFAKDVTRNAIADGHTWLIVEHPQAEGIETLADERASEVRPYWLNLLKSQVINWRYVMQAGKPILTLLVYCEDTVVSVGDYGERAVERVRVLEPGSFRLYERVKNEWELVEEGTTSLDYIPAIPVYGKRAGHFESCPPLLDLAHENVEHWQVRSDHRYALMFASVPIPVFTGVSEDTSFEWGPARSILLPNENAKAEMLESSGASLSESRSELRDIEGRMAALGLSMLVRETRAAETAEAKRIDKSAEDSALASVARAVQAALKGALQIHADYRNDAEGGSVAINRDFMDQEMDAQTIAGLSALVVSSQLSLETMWQMLREGEVLPDTFDAEVELERIAAEPMGEL